MMGLDNVNLQQVTGENLPFSSDTFDVVISNGVINLIPDKEAAMSEITRVLKPTGRLMVADQIAAGSVQKDIKARLANWFQWEGGTIPGKDFLALLEKVGFHKVEFIGETGFNSTPITKGALFRAKKTDISGQAWIIEKWTRWKCLYGCPFYNKDGYHPPFAPSVEKTKEVLGEYTQAILMNFPAASPGVSIKDKI